MKVALYARVSTQKQQQSQSIDQQMSNMGKEKITRIARSWTTIHSHHYPPARHGKNCFTCSPLVSYATSAVQQRITGQTRL
ncbi:hypothetical protein E1189_02280 [Sansalvadorimonas verongulae]|nr:hypothetical protein [Sansalvadorimonas verongulae]